MIAIIAYHSSTKEITAEAIVGDGLITIVIMLLTWQRHRPLNPMVLILVGIGVRALLIAFNSWMIMHASLA